MYAVEQKITTVVVAESTMLKVEVRVCQNLKDVSALCVDEKL
jgi:hypothetical protein